MAGVALVLSDRHGCRVLIGREHAHNKALDSKPGPGFSLVGIQEQFAFCRNWYREGEVRDLVLRYYFVLGIALRSRPHLRRCLVRCRHCRIFFLTDPRNARRKDLGCPFGCGDILRRESRNARSRAYYRTQKGRENKQAWNGERNRRRDAQAPATPLATAEEEGRRPSEPDEPVFDAGIVSHVRAVVSLVEGFPVSREDVLAMLRRSWRQRRMARRKRIDYLVRWLWEHPP